MTTTNGEPKPNLIGGILAITILFCAGYLIYKSIQLFSL